MNPNASIARWLPQKSVVLARAGRNAQERSDSPEQPVRLPASTLLPSADEYFSLSLLYPSNSSLFYRLLSYLTQVLRNRYFESDSTLDSES